jgi:hypothetical protein
MRGGSVAAKFEVTAYSKLAPPKISNLCIRIHIRILVILWMIIEYGPLKFEIEIMGLCQPVTSNTSLRNYGLCHPFYRILQYFHDLSLINRYYGPVFDITGYAHRTISNIAIRSPNSIS